VAPLNPSNLLCVVSQREVSVPLGFSGRVPEAQNRFLNCPLSESSCQHKPTLTSTKSRWKFYTEVGHRSFHTAWVKTGKAQREHIFSAVHPTTDIAKMLRHVRFVPISDTHRLLDHLVGSQYCRLTPDGFRSTLPSFSPEASQTAHFLRLHFGSIASPIWTWRAGRFFRIRCLLCARRLTRVLFSLRGLFRNRGS